MVAHVVSHVEIELHILWLQTPGMTLHVKKTHRKLNLRTQSPYGLEMPLTYSGFLPLTRRAGGAFSLSSSALPSRHSDHSGWVVDTLGIFIFLEGNEGKHDHCKRTNPENWPALLWVWRSTWSLTKQLCCRHQTSPCDLWPSDWQQSALSYPPCWGPANVHGLYAWIIMAPFVKD